MDRGNAWVRCFQPNATARLRLFCFPFAGGGASVFHNWAKELPEVEICAIQLPGRESRLLETPIRQFDQVIPRLHAAVEPYLDRPFALFGHSLGGFIAFEYARFLQAKRSPLPEYLFVSACPAPHRHEGAKRYQQLSDEAFLAEVRRMNGIPAQVLDHTELLRLVLPMLRADFALADTYVYRSAEPLRCPIIAFAGSHDTLTPAEHIEPWRTLTVANYTQHEINGDHFFLIHHQADLLRFMRRYVIFAGSQAEEVSARVD